MIKSFSGGVLRLLFPAMLATTGLLTTSCKKDSEASTTPAKDYSATDDAIIQTYLTTNTITTAQKQPSGLYYLPVVTNTVGVRAVAGRTVVVLYTGRLMDGTVFDASSSHGNVPFSFVLGQGRVIAGWDEGIALMHKGEKGVLLIPSGMGYGASGSGSSIPPNAVLRFEVELVNVL